MNLFEHPLYEFAASVYDGLKIGFNRKYKFI